MTAMARCTNEHHVWIANGLTGEISGHCICGDKRTNLTEANRDESKTGKAPVVTIRLDAWAYRMLMRDLEFLLQIANRDSAATTQLFEQFARAGGASDDFRVILEKKKGKK